MATWITEAGLRASPAMEVTVSAQLQEPCFAFALNLEALVTSDDLEIFGFIWRYFKGFLKRLRMSPSCAASPIYCI